MQTSKLTITNIQRMCFQDGPGIRTTVFLKGCSIHCPWCSNPENISFKEENYINNGKTGVYGYQLSTEELVSVVLKDGKFWGNDGGVTFSGGEALMQADSLVPVLKELKREGIHIALESALFVSQDKLQSVLPYVDYLIADMKILISDVCYKVLGGDLERYFNNLEMAYAMKKLKLIRIPCCVEYTLLETNQENILQVLGQYRDIPIQIFSIHNLGKKKYESLGKTAWEHEMVTEQDLVKFLKRLLDNGYKAEIIKI